MLRAPLSVLATALFIVALSFDSTPSVSSTPAPAQIALRERIARDQALEGFLLAGAGVARRDGQFHAFNPGDLDAEARPLPAATTAPAVARHHPEAPRELSLLDVTPDEEARRRLLYQMPYGSAISMAAERHRVDALLLAAVVSVESGFSSRAVSPRGAQGLMQVRPAVAAAYGVDDLHDPHGNLEAGSRYLHSLMKSYKGDLELALAAYNAGPAAVARYGGVPPYRETRAYVRKVLARYEEYNQKARRLQEAG
jgi:soluble lytic murein transglycosylase-like protein